MIWLILGGVPLLVLIGALLVDDFWGWIQAALVTLALTSAIGSVVYGLLELGWLPS